ncbi:MAG: hypothetical protein NTV46_09825 [Verrucomicrobia bacterium]|nr:hypothetical protein [Verrucomicrobiota bacterium]
MKRILTLLSLGLMLASCVPSTPQTRIQQEPRKFANLSARHKALVQQGQITRGMTPDAVYLAWNAPSRSFQGSKDGNMTERWDYASSYPVQVTNFYGSYGYGYGGYGHHGHHRYSGVGFGIGPEIAYVPYRIASVWFVNNRVDAWERAK